MHRFLIIRPDRVGDAIVTQVVIEALSKTTQCIIDVMASDYNHHFYKDNPYIRNIFHCNIENKKETFRYYNQLSSQTDYDAVFVFQERRRLQQLFLLGKCSRYFGFNLKFDFRIFSRIFKVVTTLSGRFFYMQHDSKQHEIINLKNLLNLGLSNMKLPQITQLPDKCKIYNHLIINPIQKIKNSIIINISGKSEEQRKITPSMLTSLLFLLVDTSTKITIVALPNDRNIAQSILNMLSLNNSNISNLLDKVEIITSGDVFEIANIVNTHEYYVGADGGLLHFAAALDLKCIGLFNNLMKLRWYPWTSKQVTLSTNISYEISPTEIVEAMIKLGYQGLK